jgi:hypothetical protein
MQKRPAFLLILLAAAVALPAFAYEYPLSSYAIRKAFLLGTGTRSHDADFYSGYWKSLKMPKERAVGSLVTIETPYLYVAEHSRDTPNYSAQEAIKEFLNNPMVFRVYLDVYFDPPEAGDPQPVVVRLIQDKKEIASQATTRWPLFRFRDENTRQESAGEHVQIEYSGDKIKLSDLSIEVDAADGEHAEVTFDMAKVR